jgi:glycosyltransferase involved in cell wall biosynthesis
MNGVSFVIPVRNGRSTIRRSLESVFAQSDGRPMEVIVVDDGSTDGSWELLALLARHWPLKVLRADGRGAAAALNRGIRQARFPVICQVDQDVLLEPGWMARLSGELRDPTVGAAQGWYQTDIGAGVFARVMGRDLDMA